MRRQVFCVVFLSGQIDMHPDRATLQTCHRWMLNELVIFGMVCAKIVNGQEYRCGFHDLFEIALNEHPKIAAMVDADLLALEKEYIYIRVRRDKQSTGKRERELPFRRLFH